MVARDLVMLALCGVVICAALTNGAHAQMADSLSSAANTVADSGAANSTTEISVTDGSEPQLSLRLPAGWSLYDQMKNITGKSSRFGMLIFCSTDMGALHADDLVKTMGQLDRGEAPSFFVDRGPAQKGTSCAGFSEKAQKQLLKMVEKSDLEKGDRVTNPFRADAFSVGACSGLHVHGEVRKASGADWVYDVRALSDGKTMYMFSLRNLKENFPKNLPFYESAMATVRLAQR